MYIFKVLFPHGTASSNCGICHCSDCLQRSAWPEPHRKWCKSRTMDSLTCTKTPRRLLMGSSSLSTNNVFLSLKKKGGGTELEWDPSWNVELSFSLWIILNSPLMKTAVQSRSCAAISGTKRSHFQTNKKERKTHDSSAPRICHRHFVPSRLNKGILRRKKIIITRWNHKHQAENTSFFGILILAMKKTDWL